jgi:hypothetical protein
MRCWHQFAQEFKTLQVQFGDANTAQVASRVGKVHDVTTPDQQSGDRYKKPHPSGPSAAPADVVYSVEPLIFFFNKLIQTTFIYFNAVTCAFELVVQPINVLRLFPSQVLGV